MKVKNFKSGLIFLGLVMVAVAVFVMAAPVAPTALNFTLNTTPIYDTDGNFTVNWTTGGGDETNYTIWLSVDGGTSFFTTADNDSVTGYDFSNGTEANYTFKIQAINDTLDDANSSLISMNVDTTAPAIEYNATGMNVDNANVSQNWVAINISGVYDLHNATGATVSYTIYNSTGAIWNQTNFTDAYDTTTINWTPLLEGVYYYNVTVNDSATNSNYTDTYTITLDTTSPTTEISIPVNTTYYATAPTLNYTYVETNCDRAWFSNDTGITNYSEVACGTNWSDMVAVEGLNNWTVFVNDSAGNENDSIIYFTYDTTVPVATLSCTPDPVIQHAVVTCTCSGTDIGGSGINSSLTTAATTPSTAATGTYTVTTCSVTDNAGNSATTTDTYSVTGASSGSSGGGSYSTSFWTKGTHAVAKEQFALGFTKQLSVRQRIKVQVGSSNHHVGITELTATAATINISSDPQQAVLLIGDERKFEVSGDNYYDIFVKLNSIENNKADVTIKSINELISEESVTAETMKEEEAIAAEEPAVETIEEKSSSLLWWIFGGIVIIIILVLVFGGANKKVEKKKK